RACLVSPCRCRHDGRMREGNPLIEPWPGDPLAERRQTMRAEEFDAVDYYVNEPGRTPPPPPVLGVYVDSALSQPEFADRLPAILADMAAVLAETVPVSMRGDESSYAVLGRAPRSRTWRARFDIDWLADALRTGEMESFDHSFAGPRDAEDL